MYTNLRVRVHVHIHVYLHTHVHVHLCVHVDVHLRVHVPGCKYTIIILSLFSYHLGMQQHVLSRCDRLTN